MTLRLKSYIALAAIAIVTWFFILDRFTIFVLWMGVRHG